MILFPSFEVVLPTAEEDKGGALPYIPSAIETQQQTHLVVEK